MDDTFLMGTTSSITMQNLGKIVQRAPAVGAKMWCLFFLFFFCFFCHAPSPEGRAFEGCIVRTRYWSKIIGRFRRGLDQMAPLQSAKFKTAFWGQYHTSVRKDSVANYGWIWTLFSVFVRGGDALCNALNISQICL